MGWSRGLAAGQLVEVDLFLIRQGKRSGQRFEHLNGRRGRAALLELRDVFSGNPSARRQLFPAPARSVAEHRGVGIRRWLTSFTPRPQRRSEVGAGEQPAASINAVGHGIRHGKR